MRSRVPRLPWKHSRQLLTAEQSSPRPARRWRRPRPVHPVRPVDGRRGPTASPLAPAATVDRVKQAESEFAAAQEAVTDETPLMDASEQFNSAAVALELAWLRLFVDAGCLPDEQKQQAEAAVSAYTTALQQDLADAGLLRRRDRRRVRAETVTRSKTCRRRTVCPRRARSTRRRPKRCRPNCGARRGRRHRNPSRRPPRSSRPSSSSDSGTDRWTACGRRP